MKNLREKVEKDFFDKLTNILDEQFPKGECKERGKVLVLNAYANIYLREALSFFKQQMKEMVGEQENEQMTFGRMIEWKQGRNKLRKELLKNIEGL